MRLEELSVFHWSYDEDARVKAPGYAIVSAYDSEEGIGYGEGRGTATGKIEGTVVWSNYPRRRSFVPPGHGSGFCSARRPRATPGCPNRQSRTIFSGGE